MPVHRKKKIPLAVFIIVCCFLFCFPFYPQAQTTIKVGLYQNVPLSFSDEKGAAKGFFIDILEYVAKKEDWTIEYHPDSWAKCLQNLENGEIDLLGGITISPQRAEQFDYSFESVQTEWGQVYTHNKFGAESILDLKLKKIAVLQGDSHFINLRQRMDSFGFAVRFIEAFEYETVMELVEVGRCDVGVVSYFFKFKIQNGFGSKLIARVYLSPFCLHALKRIIKLLCAFG